MQQVVKNMSEKMDGLYSLYELVIELGNEIMNGNNDDVVKHTDHRHRVLNKTNSISKECREELKAICEDNNIPSNEKAFLLEKRKRISDLSPKMSSQNQLLTKNISERMSAIRDEILSFQKRKQAISAYITAPQAKPFIS